MPACCVQFLSHCRIFGAEGQSSYLSDLNAQKKRQTRVLCLCVLYKWAHEREHDRMYQQARWTKTETQRNDTAQQVSTLALTGSEPCWRALSLKLKRALTWHILVSNCCLLSLINNGAEFEYLQIRALNLLSLSLSLMASCAASAFVDPQCLGDDLFYHYITSFLHFSLLNMLYQKSFSEAAWAVISTTQCIRIYVTLVKNLVTAYTVACLF